MKDEITVTPALRKICERIRECTLGASDWTNNGRIVYRGSEYMLKGSYYGWLSVHQKRKHWGWRRIADMLCEGPWRVFMSERDLPFLARAVSRIEAGVACKRGGVADARRIESETIDSLLNL